MNTNFLNTRFVTLALVSMLAIGSLVAQAPDRSTPPAVGAPSSLKLPPIKHLTLKNGLKVVFMEKHEVPLVEMLLVVRAGSVNDPAGKSGIADLTANMMEEGAGKRNSLEFADAIDYLGSSINVFAGMHTTTLDLHTALAKLDASLDLFADVALRPTFPGDELERQRKDRLTSLLQAHDESRTIANVITNRTLFGGGHPYGTPTGGDEASNRSFSVADLKSFYGTWFHPNNATLIVVGDLKEGTIVPKLEAAFGKWKKADVPKTTVGGVQQIADRTVYMVDKPGAAQSEIRIGRIGVERTTPDYYALVVMNTILGGSFTSRLNHNLRETKGYTYGASSGFDFRPYPGAFTARAAVQTAVTDSSLIEFFKELNGIMEPVTDDEVVRARNLLTLRYPENFQSVSQIAGRLSDLVTYNLPDSYFNEYVGHINAITKDEILRVAKKYLDPNKVAVIVVGDKSKVGAGIDALKLGTVKNLSIEDVLGKAPDPQR